jgi:para-aminobenzoate synthetase component 1
MLKIDTILVNDLPDFKERLTRMAKNYPLTAIYDSNQSEKSNYDLIAGFSANPQDKSSLCQFEELAKINVNNTEWYLGYLTYDLKNQIEGLKSSNPDKMNWPAMLFFKPDILFLQKNKKISVYIKNSSINPGEFYTEKFLHDKMERKYSDIELISGMSKEEYLHKVNQIQKEIKRGNIYEINFCQEFYNTIEIDPYQYFQQINTNTLSPFAAFFRFENRYLISASPERFLMKKGTKLISQPIKGTASRGLTEKLDQDLRMYLKTNIKERAENIMIVDLVRNDLSKIAMKDSVNVTELCGIYSFPFVHQMISTISAEIRDQTFYDIIKATFPMGSMTGAPKISSMKYIEQFEIVKRGLYSGSVGYIAPGMDFDFNVVIRSLQYNSTDNYLSYMTGSAITALSDPEKEYKECLLKAYAVSSIQKKKPYAQPV